jgi:hypothetical protein
MPKSSSSDDLTKQARFVFKGTVQKLKAATIPEIEDKSRTAIVRVDQIIRAPEALSHFAGHEITVQLSGKKKMKVGEQSIFYTNGWLFGESIAVVSLGQHAVEEASAGVAMAMTMASDPVENLRTLDMKERYNNADIVLTGRVVNVQLPTDSISAAASAADPLTPSSEHDPIWNEAMIEVAAVHKGDKNQKTVALRFPSSEDVMWYKAPKFKPGNEGVFMLQKGQIKEHSSAAAAAAVIETTEAYTAIHPSDFQPLSHAQSEEASVLLNLISSPE